MLKEDNIKQGFFEHEAFETLKANLPVFMQGFVTFAYMTGWRVSEIIDLTWSQVDIDNRIVRLEPMTTKNSEGRQVYLIDTLLEVVRNQKRLGKRSLRLCPFVFPNAKGDGCIRDWRKSWNAACRTAKLGYGYKKDSSYVAKWQDKFPAGPTMHDFRRTSVRNNVRAGVNETVAMKISGHKTRSVFDRYNIVNEADIKDGMCKAEQYIRAQRGHNLGTIDELPTKKGVNQ